MRSGWPNKNYSQTYQIDEFIKYYELLPHGRNLVVVKKQDKPDYILRDIISNDHFGVELTSVYLDDRSVPDIHMKTGNSWEPYNIGKIEQYKKRLIESISEKIYKARSGYDTSFPLILSVYVNEYVSIHMEEKDKID